MHLFTRKPAALLTGTALTALVLTGCGSTSTDGTNLADHGSTSRMPDDHALSAGEPAMPGMDMTDGVHHGDAGKGLRSSEDGYSLVSTTTTRKLGTQTLSFRILDAAGKAVTTFQKDQTKLLHFYLVRADVTGYLHEHPTLATDGTWTIRVNIAKPGPYRMYTDFVALSADKQTHPVVLSVPFTVPGSYTPVPLGNPSSTVSVDALTATLDGAVQADTASRVTFKVSGGGKPVTDLEQYLDSFAHLTAVHVGDLAYLHVHPELTATAGQKGGPGLPFTIELPEPGQWKLFLQVKRGGQLHLLPFVVTVG